MLKEPQDEEFKESQEESKTNTDKKQLKLDLNNAFVPSWAAP